MTELPIRRIAQRYLPQRPLYWYSLGKLAFDPLYDAVRTLLAPDRAPLLDVGCGIGILLHCLRASGHDAPYLGVDSDVGKLQVALDAAARGALQRAVFRECDLSREFPDHEGSVALLDVLQYLHPQAQENLIARAARSLTPEGLLVLRCGFADGGWRAATTRVADRCGHALRWMSASFKAQPTRQDLAAQLHAHKLRAEFFPAWGRTPFNNWLIVARRA